MTPPITPRYARVWPPGDVAAEVLTLAALELSTVQHTYRVAPGDLDRPQATPAAYAALDEPRAVAALAGAGIVPIRCRVRGYRTLVVDDPRPWLPAFLTVAVQQARPWVPVIVDGVEPPPDPTVRPEEPARA